jgi:tungstate transport system ATP-binding protein
VIGAVLALSGIRVVYGGRQVLSVDALEVPPGETLVLIGPNGSGKSTLLRVAALLERPVAGQVHLDGRRVDGASTLAARRRMAVMFQQPLLADTTVAENVALGLRFRGVPGAEREERVARWLRAFRIEGLRERRAHTLSGGEAQRVALARAFAVHPDVLLLDEPFASVDPPTREALVAELGAILRAERLTTLLVTHDRGEAQSLGHRVGVLLGGRLQQIDEAGRVFRAPSSEEVARFVGVETVVPAVVVGEGAGLVVVEAGGRKVEVVGSAAPGQQVRLCIRPEDVTLAHPEEGLGLSSARNHLSGTVARLARAGAGVRVVVDCGFPLVATVTARSVEDLGIGEGTPIVAVFKASAAHVIPFQDRLTPSGGRGYK